MGGVDNPLLDRLISAVHAWRKNWRQVYGDQLPADHHLLDMIQAIDDYFDVEPENDTQQDP